MNLSTCTLNISYFILVFLSFEVIANSAVLPLFLLNQDISLAHLSQRLMGGETKITWVDKQSERGLFKVNESKKNLFLKYFMSFFVFIQQMF